ncbi:MAG: hypothetical protein ACI82S_001211 [Patiriisocius sp.]|jgi:hypothetical protein
MKKFKRSIFTLTKPFLLSISFLLFAPYVSADLLDAFENGGFEGGTMDTNSWNSTVPPGWTTTDGTPDTFTGDTNFQGNTWAPSSTGGQFLHGIGDQPSWTESALQVALEGLTIGQQYEISFEQSITRNDFSQTGGFWRIKFGDETQESEQLLIPDAGIFEGWIWQTLLFTATQEIQTLEVIAWSDTDGLRTDIGIDSFFLGDPGTNPDNPVNVAQPAVFTLMLAGLMGIGFTRRRKL